MRTPIQIMTSVSAAVSAFILPLALATIVPDLPAGPTIEPMFEELEVLLALEEEPPEPAEASAPSAPEKTAKDDARSASGSGKRPAVEATAATDQDAAPATVSKHPARGRVHARVATDWHVRPDLTLASTVAPTDTQGSRRKACVEPVAGIAETGAYRYDVDRSLVDYYTSHPRESEALATTAWHKRNGEIDGFRVKKVRCGSPLHQLGFRNGDVVHSVDGKPVTSLTQALRAFRKLRRNDTLSVKVTGYKGNRKVLRYRMT